MEPSKDDTVANLEKIDGDGQQPSVPDVAPGSIPEIKALYAKPDARGRDQWVTQEPADAGDAAENSETARYAFLVRKRKSYDSRKKYDVDSIIVQSPWLKKSLGVILAGYPGITTNLSRLVFQAPFHPFGQRWAKFEEMLQRDDFEEPMAKEHLQLLHDVLFEELKNAIAAKMDLVKNNVIDFEHAWTIFEPGALIYSVSDGKECVLKLTSSQTLMDQRRGLRFLALSAWAVDWDGTKFGRNETQVTNYEFPGTNAITSLRAYPLEFHPQREQLIKRLTIRGRLFERFAGYHYQAYQGVALGYGRCGMIRHNIESRIIIDCDAHNRFVPNREVSLSPLTTMDKAGAVSRVLINGDEGEDDDDSDLDRFDDENESNVNYTPDSDDDDNSSRSKYRRLGPEELLLAVPYVRGYALKPKIWLWFYVDQIEPIKFAENAFTSLVIPSQEKQLIRAFVQSQVKFKDDFDDVIAGKGRGMIMLLAGPPGVGKTLTAESVAETLKVPLYMMSAGDLGLDQGGIEDSLNLVLDMVAKWNAVLLLDEADVFLEARDSHDLERNKMVSIFLRLLEYYSGVLFLTTNRISNIDPAFHSRIHVTVNYPNLSVESRKHIWQTFLGKESAVTEKDIDHLSQVDLNGRQIKNMLKTARMLARSEEQEGDSHGHGQRGHAVELRHIETVLAIERGAS
ncbi:AAA family ATPase [Exophiala viscosa]|uniref:AAA family ATPase n=1 Tax=Exophiala viscosa TaxID=2486360 RepID=A0AAN6ICM6_9EURO|nr:AAA family ATPase [Exophiala viscosa]